MEQRRTTILHLITTLKRGGTEMMLLKLISIMDKSSFSNQVICLGKMGPLGQEIVAQGIPVHCLNMPRGRLSASGLVKLWRLIRSIRPEILQTWLYHSDLLGFILGRVSNVKNVCWNIRCSYMDLEKYRISTKWTMKLCSILSRFTRCIITNSTMALEYHVRFGYDPRPWKVIPNGFDLKRFQPDETAKPRLLGILGLLEGKKTESPRGEETEQDKDECVLIGFIARYDPMKDHSTFLKAASSLLREQENVHFVLVGRGVDLGNRSLSAQLPNAGNDHFHLLGERDDIENITAGLDIACSVSHGEGFPNTVGEAMASGVPCVVTNVGDSARIVNSTGYVVPPRDPEALVKAWRELIEMGQDERRKLGAAARKRVLEHFELSKVVKAYETLYTSLTGA